jgi:hypothetical protein
MTIATNDLLRLRWSIALLLAALICAIGAVAGLRHFADRTEAGNRQLAAQVADIRGRLSRARDEELDIRNRIARYQQLVARGVIGAEARLDWIEQIARIKAERRLLGIDYEILPQVPVGSDLLPPAAAGPYEFMVSPMKLKLRLLHEEDLLHFLGDLRRAISAELLVRECRLERAEPDAGSPGLAAHLRADCLLDLITLREKPQ